MTTYNYFRPNAVKELGEALAHIVSAMNEPTPEAQRRTIDFIRNHYMPFCVHLSCPEEKLIEEPDKYVRAWERVYKKVRAVYDLALEENIKREAWYIIHPEKELTEEEKKEIDKLESVIAMYENIDNPTFRDENLRLSAERAQSKIDKIKGIYRRGSIQIPE